MNDDIRGNWPIVMLVYQGAWRYWRVTMACSWDRQVFRIVQKKTQRAYDFLDDWSVNYLPVTRPQHRLPCAWKRSFGPSV